MNAAEFSRLIKVILHYHRAGFHLITSLVIIGCCHNLVLYTWAQLKTNSLILPQYRVAYCLAYCMKINLCLYSSRCHRLLNAWMWKLWHRLPESCTTWTDSMRLKSVRIWPRRKWRQFLLCWRCYDKILETLSPETSWALTSVCSVLTDCRLTKPCVCGSPAFVSLEKRSNAKESCEPFPSDTSSTTPTLLRLRVPKLQLFHRQLTHHFEIFYSKVNNKCTAERQDLRSSISQSEPSFFVIDIANLEVYSVKLIYELLAHHVY